MRKSGIVSQRLTLHVECGMTNDRSESTETESSDSLIKHGYGPSRGFNPLQPLLFVNAQRQAVEAWNFPCLMKCKGLSFEEEQQQQRAKPLLAKLPSCYRRQLHLFPFSLSLSLCVCLCFIIIVLSYVLFSFCFHFMPYFSGLYDAGLSYGSAEFIIICYLFFFLFWVRFCFFLVC